MSNLCATIFGQELNWTVSTAVLVLMLAQLVLVAVALLALVFLLLRRYVSTKRRQNILVAQTTVEGKEHTLVGISLDTTVVKRTFTAGDMFDCEGLVVIASYNSEPATQTVTDYWVDPPDLEHAGKQTVTVHYGSFTSIYTIEVIAKETERLVVGLELDTSAVRKEFDVGEPFECGGLIVRAKYDSEPLEAEVYDYTVDEPDMTKEGERSIAVRFGGFVEFYEIAVRAAKERKLLGIDLDLDSVKTDFLVGEPFDSTGLRVILRYENEPDEVTSDFTVEAPELTEKGMYNVTVRYGELTQTYPIFVAEGRALLGISLDTTAVRREFAVGEEFNCMGLIVTANYDAEPLTEEVVDYETEAPDLSVEGSHEVKIGYLGKTASYLVTVVGAESEAALAEEGTLRYDRSFTARLIQSSDETKHWYTLLKNELLSYKKVHDRMSWKRETYRLGREPVAKFGFRGKVLCLFLPLDPAAYAESRYKVEDVSANKSFEDTPCMYRIKNDMRVKRAMELIAEVMARLGAVRTERIAEDYYLPYEGIRELVEKGLAKRLYVSGEDFGGMGRERTEEVAEAAIALAATEESVEGGVLRYNKSFRAKVIQSDDETKKYYSALKNELLSYKKVRDRLSWKRETYRVSGRTVAKIGYRGKTLCLFLPLDPAEFADSRYKVEDVSSNKSGEETPCMFRIKNEKRLRLAIELIERVMTERGISKGDRPEEDYAEPYRDVVQLIEEGLVRREIKSKQEEDSAFRRGE